MLAVLIQNLNDSEQVYSSCTNYWLCTSAEHTQVSLHKPCLNMDITCPRHFVL